ncbi:MAG: cytochrome c biogenesis protein CcsA [bacterium]
MLVLLELLNILLPLGYLLAVLNYLVFFVSAPDWSRESVTPVAWTVAGLHLVYLVLETIAYRHVPIANVWEAFSFVAFALTVVYLVLESILNDKATGVFLLAPALFFQIVSSAFVTHTTEVAPILRSSLFGFHVSAALLGYAAFAIAAVYGTLYILLYRELKGHRVGLIYQRLPSLEILGRLTSTALSFGWITLTLAIILGAVWSVSLQQSGQLTGSFLTDPKFLSTLVVWFLYGICVWGRWLFKWPTRWLAWLSIAAFVLMVFSSFAVNLFLKSFHSFI